MLFRSMATARIAVGPRQAPWVEDAVRAGGARVVDLADAEGLIWLWSSPDTLAEALTGAPGVRWVQLPLAGVDRFAAAGLFGDGRLWTCAKGLYSDSVAEHALALTLSGLRRVVSSARATSWARPEGTLLHDGRVTVVGGGGITTALVGLLAPFRAAVTVVRRHPDPFPGAAVTVGPDRLHAALSGADAVILALALTPETTGMIGTAELEAMEPHAWLVNVARGAHVRTDDLVKGLEAGVIGGAALDVTDPEPLPDGHPLWSLPNCVVTPHAANTPEMSIGPLTRRITDNVARFAAGQTPVGVVDPVLGY